MRRPRLSIPDPMESMIQKALEATQEPFLLERQNEPALDFYLPRRDVYIEVKQFHSPRIADQMARAPNIIAAQGKLAVQMLADLLRRHP